MCFEVPKKALAEFDQGRGFERGRGGNLSSPSMALFYHTCYRHVHHILTFHTTGDTWPVPFIVVVLLTCLVVVNS